MAEHFVEYFNIEGSLGRGAFGKVYKVRSREDNRLYALKVIQLDNYDIRLSDARKEFNVTARMDHANIMDLYKCFEYQNVYGRISYFAIQMDYCPNGDLTNWIFNRNGTLLRRRKLLSWMGDLSNALEYIHSRNVIHRDLKPDNILLDRNHILKISDFGIAKIMTQYYAMSAVGTPHFVAPEVLMGKPYTRKADVYSLGKVFVCLATVRTLPGNVSDIPERFDDNIVDIIEDCVEGSAKKRPTASQLYDRVEQFE